MASWVCKEDGTVFTVGAVCCPTPECGARNAHELGGDKALNVYDAVEVTGVRSPGDAWGLVNEGVAQAIHDVRQATGQTMPAGEARSMVMEQNAGLPALEDVAQRLGLVPGDRGAADSSTDPAPVGGGLGLLDDERVGDDLGKVEFEAHDDGTDRQVPDAVEGDSAERVDDRSEDTPDTGNAKSRTKAGQKDVPS